jgi:hypothetical protein
LLIHRALLRRCSIATLTRAEKLSLTAITKSAVTGYTDMNAACRYACFLFLAFVLDTGPLSSSSAPVEIPFEYSSKFGLVLVKAEVNGKPAVLVLDTGSNQTIVSSTLVVVKQGSLMESASTAKGSGYSGTGVFATAFLRIGPLNWRNHRILVMEMRDFSKSLGQDVDGILGMDLLQEFDTVTVDLRHHRLLLR